MTIQITIPSPGESITEVVLGAWLRANGDWVEKDEPLVEIESDKVTLEVPAPESGVLSITAESGAEMQVGDTIAAIDPRAARPAGSAPAAKDPVADTGNGAHAVEVATANVAAAAVGSRATSVARKLAADKGVDLAGIPGTGPSGRITKSDVLEASSVPAAVTRNTPALATPMQPILVDGNRPVRRVRMSTLRQRIAERLVSAQHTAAMLTTFNEVDMSEVMRLRTLHKESFIEKYGVGLGFMSFFIKACVGAIKMHEGINASIVGSEVEYHDFVDVSIAVGTPKGLVVPVLRSAETMDFATIEASIKDLALRREGKLTMEDMSGGTFTISNGGVYGSMMSTPILNPPQSGILGMHNIMKRAVEDPDHAGHIVLRPMMYLALSYDHRIVDGEQAVRFLVQVKEQLERPERMLLGV